MEKYRKKIYRTFAIISLIIYICYPSFAEIRFKPWNADVGIGDENIAMIKRRNIVENKTVRVFGAPQGGAYFMIRAYQVLISPQHGPSCPYTPTCSNYGRIAVLKYGAVLGGFIAGDRLLRCNPFGTPGYDPVPDSIFK